MRRSNLLLTSSSFMFLLMSTSLKAAMPVSLQNMTLNQLPQEFKAPLTGLQNKLQLSPTVNKLQRLSSHMDENHVEHIRMQQYYAGFPVLQGHAIIHKSAKSLNPAQIKMNGMLYQALEKDLGVPSSTFISNGANALQQFKQAYQGNKISQEEVTPMIFIDSSNHAFWAYKVSILVEFKDKIPERPTAILDAGTFSPYMQWNNVKTVFNPVQGKGWGGNTRAPKKLYGKDLPFLNLLRDPASGFCVMENSKVKVIDMKHQYESQNNPMKFVCKPTGTSGIFWTGYRGNGFDRQNGAFSPSNDALYAGEVINAMYQTWIGIPPLTVNSQPMKLVMRVHYGDKYENAFWDGEQMTFGDGDKLLYPLVSLGIGAHEISHGFTEQHSNLLYFGQSGGMNEAFSDMAAQAAEYYSQNFNDWIIGAEIIKKDSGLTALRYMDRPSLDGASIERADQYHDELDVHYSSGVYNRLFYLLATSPKWDTRVAFKLMVKANMDYWTPNSTFSEGACGILSAASDLKYSIEKVKAALDEVGIDYTQCEMIQG